MLQVLTLQKGSKCNEDAKFNFWRSRHFKPELAGSKNLIYCAKTNCPVEIKELFHMTAKCHVNVGHAGRDKTWVEVCGNYSGGQVWRHGLVPKNLHSCSQWQVAKSLPSGKAMINLTFHLTVQII